ncbi:MAG TPA: hypothetical protein VK735_36805 [Pseudonocardia sp.]|uniref:hypothetical protein n=1 Tax=Pseudonocardia sp. TaxID=60912 RepID=UPI002C43AEFA|nr:hypothetical protein [Pseudonocardia sp.]HTF53039.1 hypothetical protein [Pseudonocardia sp.]
MSAPTVERTRPARQPSTRTPRRSAGAPAPRDANGAIGRAYARRAVREKRLNGDPDDASAGRSQFVLLIMVLLGVGLVASLWLSTTAAADSYRLDSARQATRDLSERSESLRTEIASMQSAPALAQAASRMGMVQVSDVARLVAQPDGTVAVVGVPKAAVAPAPPAPVVVPPVPGQPTPGQPGQPTDQQTADQQTAGQQPTDQQTAGQQPADQQAPSQQPADQQPADQQSTDQQGPSQQTVDQRAAGQQTGDQSALASQQQGDQAADSQLTAEQQTPVQRAPVQRAAAGPSAPSAPATGH